MADFHDLLLRKLASPASLSKKRHSDANGAADALAASPTFSIPHLAVDYGEMFGSFHALKGPASASVPVLDFQLLDDCDDVSVDIFNSNFNYADVFGGFDGADFAVYYEEMLAENLAEIPRIPVEAGSQQQELVFVPRIPTEELNGERLACSEESSVPSDAFFHDMFNGVSKSGASLDEERRKSEQHLMDELIHVTQSLETSGYHSTGGACSPSHISIYKKSESRVADDPGLNVNFNGKNKGKYAKESLLAEPSGNEFEVDQEKLGHKWTTVEDVTATNQHHLGYPESVGKQSYSDNAFLTISDISLQTKPLQVPPPARSPPKIFVKKEGSKRMVTRSRKAFSGEVHLCKPQITNQTHHVRVSNEMYSFDEGTGGTSLPFFDVEIDASSTAGVSVAAMREAMDKAQASLKCAKESMERKQDDIESHMELYFDGQRKVNEGSEGATAQKDHKFREDLFEEDCKSDTSKMKDLIGFEKLTAMRSEHAAPDTEDNWGFVQVGKESIAKREGQGYRLMPQCSQIEEREQVSEEGNQFDGLEQSEQSNSQDASANEKNHKRRAIEKVQIEGPHEMEVARKPVELEKSDRSMVIQEDWLCEGKNMKVKVSHELEENVIKTKAAREAHEREANKMKLSMAKEVCTFEENDKKLYAGNEANNGQGKKSELQTTEIIHHEEGYEKKLETSVKQERAAVKLETTGEPCQFEGRTDELQVTNMGCREDENKTRPGTGQDIHDDDSNRKSAVDAIDWELNEKKMKAAEEDSDRAENEKEMKMDKIARGHVKNERTSEEVEVPHRECQIKQTVENAQDFCQEDEKKLKVVHDVNGERENKQKVKTSEGVQQDGHGEKLGVAQEGHKREDDEIKLIAPQVSSVKVKIEKLKTTEVAHEAVANKKNSWQDLAVLDQLSNKNKFRAAQEVFRRLESGKKSEAAQWDDPLNGRENFLEVASAVVLNPKGGRKEVNGCGMHKIEEDKGGSKQKETHLEEWLRNVQEREIEQDGIKDSLAIGRIAHETGDVAFAEAQGKAENVILERAFVEVQTPAVISQEREASAEACQKSVREGFCKEARIPAEQAAILRETLDAQEHNMEKTFSEATSGEEKLDLRGNNEIEGSFESSNEADTGLKQGYSSTLFASETKHCVSIKLYILMKSFKAPMVNLLEDAKQDWQGINECLNAKALAEKNLRDILAQRELTEINRLAEALDAEVRRWSGGKEGNLRALLSTLQYILGPESGWKPIPLTDIVTAVAVKKAYKKAALYVHPDKVQQRHATIQQKYICEKVFDLLKGHVMPVKILSSCTHTILVSFSGGMEHIQFRRALAECLTILRTTGSCSAEAIL
ncbi:hypothetical protein ACLOJK_032673 [Asimina triloba]